MPTIDSVLERHCEFWSRRNATPLLAELPHPRWSRKAYPLSGGRFATEPYRLDPEDIDVDKLLGGDRLPESTLTDDYVNGVKSVYPVACMESIIGCYTYAADTSCYAKAAIEDEEFDIVSNLPSASEKWVSLWNSVLRRATIIAGERLPALQLHLRGVVDMVAAYLGEARMCLSFFDDPAGIGSLVKECELLLSAAVERGIRGRGEWRDGYVSLWGVYAPGPILDYQIDATSILSADQYRRFFAAADSRILTGYRYSVIHLHACGLHVVDTLAEMPGVRAIEITLERETGVWEPDRVKASCRTLQDADICVIINGELDRNELDEWIGSLDPRGLALFCWRPDPEYSS